MSKNKKPFKETAVGRFLIEKAPSILGIVGDAILPGNVISELISGNTQLSEGDKKIALEKLPGKLGQQTSAVSDNLKPQNISPSLMNPHSDFQ